MNLSTSWISDTVLTWLQGDSTIFIAEAQTWLHALAIIMLVIFAIRWALDALSYTGMIASTFAGFGYYAARLVLCTFFLHFYATPMPFGGVSFSGMIPNTAVRLSAMVDTHASQQAIADIQSVEKTLKPATLWAGAQEIIDDSIIWGCLLLMRGLMFLLSCAGFVGVGIAVTLGPLSIPFLLVPKLSWLFWDWLAVLLSMSMFQVVGSVLVAIWGNVLVTVFNNLFHGNYSVVDATVLVAPFCCVMAAMVFTCLGIGAITASLYGRAAGHLDGFGRLLLTAA